MHLGPSLDQFLMDHFIRGHPIIRRHRNSPILTIHLPLVAHRTKSGTSYPHCYVAFPVSRPPYQFFRYQLMFHSTHYLHITELLNLVLYCERIMSEDHLFGTQDQILVFLLKSKDRKQYHSNVSERWRTHIFTNNVRLFSSTSM